MDQNYTKGASEFAPLFFELALLNIDYIGPKSFVHCISVFNSAEKVFEATSQELRQAGLKEKSVNQIIKFANSLKQTQKTSEKNELAERVEANLRWANLPQHTIIQWSDPEYPQTLKHIYDYPPLLFVIGNVSLLNQRQLAIVGSRKASKLGKHFTEKISQQLVENRIVVTSGLAQGIDTAAHQGALNGAQNSTISVLAHGLDGIYPKKNKTLAANIINNGGALVSEFPVGVMPKPEYFPRRNRIISGMSQGVLVVEAEVKSGSLVTAYCALEQGREVFAVPGAITNPMSRGCHLLIKQGAKLVEGVDDLLEDLMSGEQLSMNYQEAEEKDKRHREDIKGLAASLPELEGTLLNVLEQESKTVNELVDELQVSASELAAALTMLELKQLVLVVEQGYQLHPDIL